MGRGFGKLRGRGGRAVGIKYFLRVKLLTCPSDGTWWKNGSVQLSSTLMGYSVNLRWWTFWLGAIGAKIVHVRGYSCRQMIFRTLQRIYIYIAQAFYLLLELVKHMFVYMLCISQLQ